MFPAEGEQANPTGGFSLPNGINEWNRLGLGDGDEYDLVDPLLSQASDSSAMEPSELPEGLMERIRTLKHMSPDDWRQVLGHLTDPYRKQAELQPSFLSALNVRITYDLVNALQRMDQTSARLTRKILMLTWILVACTVALLIEPGVRLVCWIQSLI